MNFLYFQGRRGSEKLKTNFLRKIISTNSTLSLIFLLFILWWSFWYTIIFFGQFVIFILKEIKTIKFGVYHVKIIK